MTAPVLLATHWRAVVLAALLAFVGTLGLTARHYHAEVAIVRADAARNEAAIQAVAAAAEARAETDTLIRNAIHAAPPSSNCSSSPVVRALLDSLYQPAGPSAPAGSRIAAHVRR